MDEEQKKGTEFFIVPKVIFQVQHLRKGVVIDEFESVAEYKQGDTENGNHK